MQREHVRRELTFVLLLVLFASLTGQVRADDRTLSDEEIAFNMLRTFVETSPERINIEDEVAFGDTITAKLIDAMGGELLDPNKFPGVWAYCNSIILALGEKNVLKRKLSFDSGYTSKRIQRSKAEDAKLLRNIGWHVGIVVNDEVGAVSAPGGYVLLTTGLLKDCRNEAELAGVIAHEMAHISRSHGLWIIYDGIRKAMGKATVRTAVGVALGKGNVDMGKTIASFSKAMTSFADKLDYGKDKEFEADEYGAEFMYRLGYNPNALLSFVSRLKHEDTHAYRSHPASALRAAKLRLFIRKDLRGADELPLLAERYEMIVKRSLAKLPPASKRPPRRPVDL